MNKDLPPALLEASLNAGPLKRVLLLGEAAHQHADALTAHNPTVQITCLEATTDIATLSLAGRFDLGIMSDLQAWGEKRILEQQLATLRDQLCRYVLIGATPGGVVEFNRADSLALGLKPAASEKGKTAARFWYKYSIIDYKQAPDWLNANDWAHPERWDRERW